MKGPAYKTILLIALPCCLVLAGLVAWFAGDGKDWKGNVPPQTRKVNELRVVGDHPYGNPIEGGLWWEDNLRFRRLQYKNRAFVRMAAFRTTLPDPLPGEEYNVALAADMLAGQVVGPGAAFSMNAALGPYTEERGFREGPVYVGTTVSQTIGGGVCKIATTLYNVATLADLQIVERQPHGMLVPYVPPGQDATVTYGVQDFKFRNDKEYPIILWADTVKNTLFMAVYGRSAPPKIRWHHQILDRRLTWTVHRTNNRLNPGVEKVVIPGADGLTVRSWLTVIDSDGNAVTRRLRTDRYTPMPRVIERGPAPGRGGDMQD